jgi:hypothetical protein
MTHLRLIGGAGHRRASLLCRLRSPYAGSPTPLWLDSCASDVDPNNTRSIVPRRRFGGRLKETLSWTRVALIN